MSGVMRYALSIFLLSYALASAHTETAAIESIAAGNATVTAPSAKLSSPTKSISPVNESQEEKNPPEKSPSILQMLEGHETALIVAFTIAGAFFLLGWICGGNYYLRRERRRRTKIRF